MRIKENINHAKHQPSHLAINMAHSGDLSSTTFLSSSGSKRSAETMEAGKTTVTCMQQEDERMVREIFDGSGYESAELNASMEAERDLLGLPTDQELPILHAAVADTSSDATTSSSTNSGSEYPLLHQGEVDPIIMRRATRSMQEAIRNLPQTKTFAYDLAMERDPQLVAIESPLERYLRANHLDHWAAANQLVEYYEKRYKVFGRERFARPLRLDGGSNLEHSALSPTTQKLAQAACFVFPPLDDFGRSIVVFERENLQDDHSNNEYRAQSTFHNLQVLSERTSAQLNGHVSLIAMEKSKKKSTTDMMQQPPWQTLRLMTSGVTPTSLKGFHMIVQKQATFLNAFIAFWMSFLENFTALHMRSRVHYFPAEDPKVCLDHMKQYGFRKHHLPKRLGGTMDPQALYKERIYYEKQLYAPLEQRDLDENGKAVSAVKGDAKPPGDWKEKLRPSAGDRLRKLKRKVNELYDDNQLRMQQRKVARLRKDHDALESCHTVLHACLVYAQYLEKQHVQDGQVIRRFVADIVVQRSQESQLQLCPDMLADGLVQAAFAFYGRHPLTGRWNISIKNLEKWPIPLQPFLVDVKNLLTGINPPQLTANVLPDLTLDLDSDSKDCDEDDDGKLSLLERALHDLNAQQEALLETRRFLESAVVLSQHHATSFEGFKRRNESLMVCSIVSLVDRNQYPVDSERLETLAHQIMDSVYFIGQKSVFFSNQELIAALLQSSAGPSATQEQQRTCDFEENTTAKKPPPPEPMTLVAPGNQSAVIVSSVPVDYETVEDRKKRVQQRRKKKSLQRL